MHDPMRGTRQGPCRLAVSRSQRLSRVGSALMVGPPGGVVFRGAMIDMTQKVILDTDIGDDIDDALALGLILASPELQLLGVTTVFKNVVARAAQARTILVAAGRPEMPVAAGCGAVMSPRVTYPFDARRAYLEGELPNQHAISLPEAELPPLEPRHGVDFLIDTVMAGAGDITIVTIGAMTNLAMAMVVEPRIISRIPRIVSMAAAFDRQESEWNIRCDPVAAAIVLGSGVPMRIVGLDVTMKVQFRRKDIEALKASPRPLAKVLAQSIAAWEASERLGAHGARRCPSCTIRWPWPRSSIPTWCSGAGAPRRWNCRARRPTAIPCSRRTTRGRTSTPMR